MKTSHFLTGKEYTAQQTMQLLEKADALKKERALGHLKPYLYGQHLALLFEKPSLRTRFSFTIAMRELGGDVIESLRSTRKEEMPKDQARVIAGYCSAIMARVHIDADLQEMAEVSPVPIINGLSDLHHPCQILADMLTLLEVFQKLKGLTIAYIGDGNNILHSLLLMAPSMGMHVHYCCPKTRMPNEDILKRAEAVLDASTGSIRVFHTPKEAVQGAHAVYTDVWTSMGFETMSDEQVFKGFQVNEALMQEAKKDAVFMHCLPMERGKEVSTTLPDQPCSVVFQQSENRLHAQKALLLHLLANTSNP